MKTTAWAASMGPADLLEPLGGGRNVFPVDPDVPLPGSQCVMEAADEVTVLA
jgi:hypothetical protein